MLDRGDSHQVGRGMQGALTTGHDPRPCAGALGTGSLDRRPCHDATPELRWWWRREESSAGSSRPHSRVGCEVARPEQEQKLPSPDRPGDVLLELSGASPPDRNKPDLEDLTIFRSRSQDLAASGFWADARRQDTGSRLASCCVIVVANDYVRCLVPRSCPLVLHAPWFGSHPCLIADCSLVVSWPRAPPGLLVALAMSPGFSRPVDSLDRGFVGRGPRTASL